MVSEAFRLPLTAATRYCAVFGHPIRHSASPSMQNAALAELGFDWRYLALMSIRMQLREAIHGARTMNFANLNLTIAA